MPFVLKVLSTMFVSDIKGDEIVCLYKFYHNDSIVEFSKHSHKQRIVATIVVCVIGMRGKHGYFDRLVS